MNSLASLRVRLLLCFALISGFSIVAALSANFAFREVDRVLELITTQRGPTALTAGELARSVERIVAIAPRLLNVRDEIQQAEIAKNIDEIQAQAVGLHKRFSHEVSYRRVT